MTPTRFRWGLILIQIGILLILRNTNVINDSFWEELIVYFPVVLIAVGIEKIFTKSRLQFISYATSVLIFFGGIAIAVTAGQDTIDGSFFSESSFEFERKPEINRTSAVLNLEHADLTVREAGRDLVRGRFNKFTRKPKIDYTVDGNEAVINFTSRKHSYLGGVVRIDTGDPQDWYISFSEEVPLSLECYGDQSDIHLNLTSTPLEKLKVEADDSKIYVRLGDLLPEVGLTIFGEDSNLRLRIPFEVGLRVDGDDYGAYLKEIGFKEEDGGYVSEAYPEAESRVKINIDNNLSSFSVDFF
ncbi:MAG: DUF5668 domain-containing protein [bacterium]|nr:DUF5668 domain-containing protein [bacterium]